MHVRQFASDNSGMQVYSKREGQYFLFRVTAKMAEVEQKKKRTFPKFTYRGIDLDLSYELDMSYEQLMQLYSARQRRRLNRGLRRKQHSLLKRLRKAKKEAPPMEKPEVVTTRWHPLPPFAARPSRSLV